MSTVEWTDAEREAVAKAIFDVRDGEHDLDEWGDLSSSDRERWECDARAALDALAPFVAAWEAQARVTALRDAHDAIRGRLRHMTASGADESHLQALNDAWGVVANLRRDAEDRIERGES